MDPVLTASTASTTTTPTTTTKTVIAPTPIITTTTPLSSTKTTSSTQTPPPTTTTKHDVVTPTISISVKASVYERIGTLCVVPCGRKTTMEQVFEKIRCDLELEKTIETSEITKLVRLMPHDARQFHSIVRKPALLSETDFYLLKFAHEEEEDDDDESEEEEEESEEEEVEVEQDYYYGRSRPKIVTPVGGRGGNNHTRRRPKAVAAVAKATASLKKRSPSSTSNRGRTINNRSRTIATTTNRRNSSGGGGGGGGSTSNNKRSTAAMMEEDLIHRHKRKKTSQSLSRGRNRKIASQIYDRQHNESASDDEDDVEEEENNNELGGEQQQEQEEEQIVAKKPRNVKPPHLRGDNKNALSYEQRQALKGTTLDLDEFEHYLYQHEGMGKGNVHLVMKQARKFCSGEGITYKNWKQGVIFKPGYIIPDLSEDFDALRSESILFEQKHGRDKGNGYLMRHPLRKIENYQKFLYQQLEQDEGDGDDDEEEGEGEQSPTGSNNNDDGDNRRRGVSDLTSMELTI